LIEEGVCIIGEEVFNVLVLFQGENIGGGGASFGVELEDCWYPCWCTVFGVD
jgi:hypothetical protein